MALFHSRMAPFPKTAPLPHCESVPTKATPPHRSVRHSSNQGVQAVQAVKKVVHIDPVRLDRVNANTLPTKYSLNFS